MSPFSFSAQGPANVFFYYEMAQIYLPVPDNFQAAKRPIPLMWVGQVVFTLDMTSPDSRSIWLGTITEIVTDDKWIISSDGREEIDVDAIAQDYVAHELLSKPLHDLIDKIVAGAMKKYPIQKPGDLIATLAQPSQASLHVVWVHRPSIGQP